MFRIRRVYDYVTQSNRDTVAQVQAILRTQFPGLSRRDIAKLPDQLRNPLKYRFRTVLFVAEDSKSRVRGFATLLHEPVLKFCYLDYISASILHTGRGIGSAIYERVREEALQLDTIGLFFECLPDDPHLSHDPIIRKQNVARLRFYERYGARPIVDTAYETPVTPGDDNPPYLVWDNLGHDTELGCYAARSIVQVILERKYGDVCPREYVQLVVDSFQDDPVKLRPPRYFKRQTPIEVRAAIPLDRRIALVVNDRHEIHHVQELGYVEAPVRINSILAELDTTDHFIRYPPRTFSEKHIRAVHDNDFVDYIRKACEAVAPGQAIYPYVFPIRNATRPPRDLPVRAGYYCIDTFTPLSREAYLAAKRAVDCSVTAAKKVVEGHRMAYALVRPPGHHAESRVFGGFCYFNSAAVAAHYLSRDAYVAILDIDYHHGNGQQEIFYDRDDVLTLSIHGNPNFAYPYFSGFADERGSGAGRGYNINAPLPEKVSREKYFEVLRRFIKRIHGFQPGYLVVALGLDTAKGDPTGTWEFEAADFTAIGHTIGNLRLPTLVVQEGGYDTQSLGVNARHFLMGLWERLYGIN